MKIGVFIGRMSPFTTAHESIVKRMLAECDQCAILLGSAYQPRTVRNPFTFEEREKVVRQCFPDAELHVVGIEDSMYNDDVWLSRVQSAVTSKEEDEVYLYGMTKDETSYYLDLFPTWKRVPEAPHTDVDNHMISATNIRDFYFQYGVSAAHSMKTSPLLNLPAPTTEFLSNFQRTSEYTRLKREHDFLLHYKVAWEVAPYPPVFVTTDAVVTCLGHILLIKRGSAPGEGLWALPGGFLDQKQTLVDSAIRELKEETKIKVPVPVLKGSIVSSKTFDNPNRSLRGRTITTAYHIKLDSEAVLPKVKGSDDAIDAKWIPLSEVVRMGEVIYEDHLSIIEAMVGVS